MPTCLLRGQATSQKRRNEQRRKGVKEMTKRTRSVAMLASLLALATCGLTILNRNTTSAKEQEATPKSSRARSMRRERTRNDTRDFARRGDIRRLPPLLKARLIELAARPHSFEPITAFSEAADPSQLFQ